MVNITPQIHYSAPDGRNWWIVSKATHEKAAKIEAILAQWRNHLLPLPKRNFITDDSRHICLPSDTGLKQIDRAWIHEWIKDNENTVRRELTHRIKLADSPLLATNKSIIVLEKLLLILAADPKKRQAMKDLNNRYQGLIQDMRDNHMTPELETISEQFYNDFISWLSLSDRAMAPILEFSWATSKPEYKHFPHSCHAWMIIVCILDMVDLR